MPLSTTMTLAGLLQWAAAFLACAWAMRTHKSRALIVLLPTGAAALAGLLMVVPLVEMNAGVGDAFEGVPYRLANLILSSAILGALVGIAGVVWQTFAKRKTTVS